MIRVFFVIFLLGSASPVLAQTERKPSNCHAIAQDLGATVWRASWNEDVAQDSVRIHYVSHASFLLRSAGGLNMITDYTGFVGTADFVPDVVTMNHAHSTHWTPNPDPAIPHVLPGWGEFGVGIEHNLDLGEVLVRNVSTDIRSSFSGVEEKGNSIFVFEMVGLCIGHLGHLHHEPSDEQFAAIGRLDVVMAAVDGGTTLDLPTMMNVIRRLKSSIVIPMHWFADGSLGVFLQGMSEEFAVVEVGGPALDVSLDRLPSSPTIMVLRPAWLRE